MKTAIFEVLKDTVLIKDFSSFKKTDWMNFGNFNDQILEYLQENRHQLQLKWTVKSKFGLDSLEVSFFHKNYTNSQKCDIIESSTLFDIEYSKLILKTEVAIPICFIDRSFYNNSVKIALTESESNLISLYERLFKRHNKEKSGYNHNVRKTERLVFDNEHNIEYLIKYAYYGVAHQIKTAIGVKGIYQCISTTTDEDFEWKLKNMIENFYTIPILNKKIHELTDDDILVLEMNNT